MGLSFFVLQQERSAMQIKKSKRLYNIVVEYQNGMTRSVKIRAVTREIAEKKALKFHPNAIGVKHDA
jgi:phenylacetate-coenzyme A ligase PaaK-like adenylate-forming protein